MANKKKPTNREIVAKVESLTKINNTLCQMVDNLALVVKGYIEYKGDKEDFLKYTEDRRNFEKKIMEGK